MVFKLPFQVSKELSGGSRVILDRKEACSWYLRDCVRCDIYDVFWIWSSRGDFLVVFLTG